MTGAEALHGCLSMGGSTLKSNVLLAKLACAKIVAKLVIFVEATEHNIGTYILPR